MSDRASRGEPRMTKIGIEGDSEAAVALALLRLIAEAEGHVGASGALQGVDKAWVLDTFAECLVAAYGEREVEPDEEDGEEDDEEDEEADENAAKPAA
jgi:hypothetical protein